MTGTGGKRNTGHFYRVRDDESSPSFCGRQLGGQLTSPIEPHVCVPCLKGLEKQRDFDHHHVLFENGKWIIRWTPRNWSYFSSSSGSPVLTAMSSQCAVKGCTEMIPHRLLPQTYNTGQSSNTIVWNWNWAA